MEHFLVWLIISISLACIFLKQSTLREKFSIIIHYRQLIIVHHSEIKSSCVCYFRREFFAILGGREGLLIVQCDSTDRTLDLVACARHLLIEECRETEKELDQECIGSIHILMIVQLARVAGGCPDFVAVQGEGWLSVHIDELCPPSEEIPPIEAMTGRSVSRIFEGALNKTEDNFTVRQVLTSCVQEAASRIEDDDTTLGRATKRVELMVSLLSAKTSTTRESMYKFLLVLLTLFNTRNHTIRAIPRCHLSIFLLMRARLCTFRVLLILRRSGCDTHRYSF